MSISNDLRQAVLQAAIQGKLTKQLLEDGNAKNLLEQIKAEKAKLIEEGKLKKEKPLPEITEDEKPFDIPENWEWMRLGVLCDIVTGRLDANAQIINGEYAFFTCGREVYRTDSYAFDCDAILLGGNNASGDYKMHRFKGKFNAYQRVYVISGCDSSLLDYFYCAIKYWLFDLKKNSFGTATRFIKLGQVTGMLIPIPPLAEQKRIVAKVEELMAKIDELEKTEKELEALKKAFPADMKASLLQAAMQGKLTEQLPEDGNAKDLLEQIKAEKAKLINEGKLKKEKPLPEITEDEIPFDIPENWEWVRLGEIGKWGAGSTPSKSHPDYYGGNIPWLLTGDLNNGYINSVEGRITELALKETSVKLNPVGSVLIAMYGATIGKLGILNIEATTNQACCAGIPYNGIYNKFLFYFLMAHKAEFVKRGEGGAQPNISREKIIVTLMPLPPLSEQKRIVKKLEKLLPLCDGLK